MLTLKIMAARLWDEGEEVFINIPACTLVLEHSLIAISKWEAKWHKPFMSKDKKTHEETIDYIRCMTISPKDVPIIVYQSLTNDNIQKVNEYLQDPMTATTFSKREGSGNSRKIMTNEVIYYYMIKLQIPVEFERWHINRLMTLIQVCIAEENPKKMNRNAIMKNNAAINAANRARYHSKG